MNPVHPITVEVVRNAVVAYADEMANVLAKSAYNMMIYEVRDYCCGLLDAQARMISQNRGGLPIFLSDLGPAVEDGIARYGLDGFAPGDIVIMNHAGVCGSVAIQLTKASRPGSTRRWGLLSVMPDIEGRIAALPIWSGKVELAPLVGGISNQSFVATDSDGKYVVRVTRDFPFHHVFRDREVMTARAAATTGFAPSV